MDKPLILIEQDMKQDVANIVNKYKSQLPMSVLINTFNDILNLCTQIQAQQLEQATAEYEKSLVESEVE